MRKQVREKQNPEEKDYTYRSMRDERQYGFFWYSGAWQVLRPILVALTVAVLVIGIVAMVRNKVYNGFIAPVDEKDDTEYSFEITSGQSLSSVAEKLLGNENPEQPEDWRPQLIRNKTAFKLYCDFAGMGQKIQVGSYTLKKNMNMMEIAEQLTAGDGNIRVRNITLIPGETVEDFAKKLQDKGVLDSAGAAHFLSLCKDGSLFTDYYFIQDIMGTSTMSQRKYALEGYLAPNTYEVYVDVTPEEIIRKLLSQTGNVFTVDYQDRAAELNMTMDQVLTMASMIEKEARESDFARVSAVFHNRRDAGMKLESDVTIHYITGVRKMALTETDTVIDNPYNTYRVPWLPVGPICNPSPAAIRAALYPDETMRAQKYLFFCAKEPESGELYFSRTLEEHNRAVNAYRDKWKQYDESRGIQ